MLFSAESSFFSIGGSHLNNALWDAEERAFWGDRYWSFPGRYGDIEQGLAQYNEMVERTLLAASQEGQQETEEERKRQEECANKLVNSLLERDKLAPYVARAEVGIHQVSGNDYWISVTLTVTTPLVPLLQGLGTFSRTGSGFRSNVGRLRPGLELVPDPTDKFTTAQGSDVDYITPRGDLGSLVGHFFRDVLKVGANTPCNALKRLGG
jgi:hypothetical protein